MGYDPKDRALGWGDVGAGYLVTVASIAGMALLLSAETPERLRNGHGAFQSETAFMAFEDDMLTMSRSEVPSSEAGEDAMDAIHRDVPRSCPGQQRPKSRAFRYVAG